MSSKQIHVVGAAILRGHTCLVAQRGPGMSLPGKWEFPGGKVGDGETAEAALAREIEEEFGVDIDVYEKVGEGRSEVGGREIWLEVFRAEITSGELVPVEHAAVRWVGVEKIDELDWAEADVPVVGRVKELMRR